MLLEHASLAQLYSSVLRPSFRSISICVRCEKASVTIAVADQSIAVLLE